MMWGWGNGFSGNWGWMLLSGLGMIIFWIVVIAVVVYVVRAIARPAAGSGGTLASPGQSGKDAVAILKERYARGEISKAEYEEIRHDLQG